MPKRLAEIVIDAELASREQVIRTARSAEEQRIPLVAALVRHAGLDELALVAAIRRRVRVPLIDPAVVENDPEALRELPQEVCSRLRVMPLSVAAFDTGTRVMQLAMADPTDAMAIAEVEHITGCQVESHLMPLSAIEELVQKSYRSFVTEVMRRDRKEPGKAIPARQARMPDTHRVVVAAHAGVPAGADPAQPTTVPFHRVSDEASLEVRHRALLDLLVKKEIVTESEYEEQIRLLLRQREEDT